LFSPVLNFKNGCHAEPVEAWRARASARVLRQAQDGRLPTPNVISPSKDADLNHHDDNKELILFHLQSCGYSCYL